MAFLEGRSWMKRVFNEFDAKPVGTMKENKYYLHQLYTTVFIEFETMEELEKCKKWLNENVEYWDYDPVVTLDTSDKETIRIWKEQMIS